MGVYWGILDGVREAVAALPGLIGKRVTLRRMAAFVPMLDEVPQVVIAPRDDLAERLVETQFSGSCHIIYEVNVLIIASAEWDMVNLRWRLDRREEVRLAVWRPLLLAGVAEAFDCDYDPSPGLSLPAGAEGLVMTAQRFDFKAAMTRG